MPHEIDTNQLILGFDAVVDQYERNQETALPDAPSVNELVDRLCYVNLRQWSLEDEARAEDLNADNCLRLMRAIQRSNSERSWLISQIDRMLAGTPSVEYNDRHPQEKRLIYHETIGQIVDILVILQVRRYHMRRAAKDGALPPSGYTWAAALRVLDEQIDLCRSSCVTLQHLYETNQVDLPPYAMFKLYGGSFG